MTDVPTCRGCRTGEENAKLREKYKSVLAAPKTHATNPTTGRSYCGKRDVALSGDVKPTCSMCAGKWKSAKTISDFKAKQQSRAEDQIKIKLTNAQAVQVNGLGDDGFPKNMNLKGKSFDAILGRELGKTLVFDSATYEEDAKTVVLALEERRESLLKKANEQRKTLKDWNDKSPENAAAFAEQKAVAGRDQGMRWRDQRNRLR